MHRFLLLLTGAILVAAGYPREVRGEVDADQIIQQEPAFQSVSDVDTTVMLGLQLRPLPFPVRFPPLPDLPFSLESRGITQPRMDFGFGQPFRIFAGAGLGPAESSVTGGLLGLEPGGGEGEGVEGDPSAFVASGGQEVQPLFQSEFAEVAVQLRGRGEFGGNWTRFQPCEVGLQESCDPGLFPQIKPDIQFGLQASGIVAKRIHIDVDYDEAREFSAVNNVNLFYQGEEGEVIRRVEVGDVTLTFPESRFLAQGIPAGNFGFRAVAELGPVDVQTVWAQQNGDISSRDFQL